MGTTIFQIASIGLISFILFAEFVYTQGHGKIYPRDDNAFAHMDDGEEVLVALLLDKRNIRKDNETCKDTMKGCLHYVKYCKTHKHVLKGRCDRSCRYCGPPLCVDKRSDCADLKVLRSCKDPQMKEICEKSCGYCVSCQDKWNPGHCAYLKTFDKCDADLRMQDFCHHTCGFCKLPEPAPCMKTKYGCCWDKVTAKNTADGINCPACIDKFKRLCKRLQKGCISSSFVRKNCHSSCNYCPLEGAECNDDPEKTHLCKFWNKELNFCLKNPEVMRHFCPVSCGMDCSREQTIIS